MGKKINIDFDILDTKNPFYMSILDQSEWGLLKDNTAYIEITLPGYSNPLVKYFEKNAINTYNAYTLDLLCVSECTEGCYEAIPDGIYTIKISSTCNTYSKERKFLKTTLLELELDKYIIKNISCGILDPIHMNKITELEFIIKSAKANLRYDNIGMAGQLYEKALEDLEDIKNCC